jgi:UDP-N-acetylmuramoylalanine--D-glutamate ligase
MMPDPPDWLVIEVSSFQLETVTEFRPEIGLLLNLLPNHLDRHGNMEIYRNLKFRLFEKMTETDTAIVPFNLCRTVGKKNDRLPDSGKKRLQIWKTFGTEEEADFRYDNGRVGKIDLQGTWFANDMLGSSAAAVAAVCDACKIPPEAMKESALSFEPLPHRTQFVAEIGGVTFIDDSKATNLAAMCAALKMVSGRIHLIAGGRSKENDFSFAKDLLVKRVLRLYLIGEASSAMQAAWKDRVECLPCETLENAVCSAWGHAKAGDTVLLSPACTSYDQFRSFGERGDCFAAAVRRLRKMDADS